MNNKDNAAKAVQGTANAKNVQNPVNPAKANEPNGPSSATPAEQGKAEQHSAPGTQPRAPEQTPTVQETNPPLLPQVVKSEAVVLSMDDRLKEFEQLEMIRKQYLNLLQRIDDLERFQFRVMEASDELTENYFGGCKIILQDGNGNSFVTNTPNLVKMVHNFIKVACTEKKAELEKAFIFSRAA